MDVALYARTCKVMEILESWKRLGINGGWVSRYILSADDAGGFELDAIFETERKKGKTIEESKHGRFGTPHYRIGG